MATALRIDRLSRAFGGSPALDDVTLEVDDGELLTLVGPSGSGKSTLLRIVAGLERADAGRVFVGGEEVTTAPPPARGVAMVFQGFALFPHLDVAANIEFGMRARGVGGAERATRVREVGERLGIAGLLGRRPAQLSGGERQRVALARGLVARPRVLLLDEPLSNLDAQLRAQARAELRVLQATEGIAMVHVTHDQAEALALGTRVAVLDGGRLAQHGTPEDVYERPADTFVARFIGTPPMNLVEPDLLGIAAPEGALAGFRPEDAVLGDETGVVARLVLVERAGHDVIWHLDVEGARVQVRPGAGTPPPATGADVRLAAPAGCVRLFDRDSGRAL